MSTSTVGASRDAGRIGGLSLIAAAVGFMAVFGYLAARFDYPTVLDGAAAEVLPRLIALGDVGRGVWIAYSFLPLLLIPAGVGAHAALRGAAPSVMRAALIFSVLAAGSMLLGLARWPSVHWELGRAYAAALPDARVAIDAVFRGLNVYLGNFIGEFLGELSLYAFFILIGVALRLDNRRWVGWGSIAAGVIGLIAARRNVTPAVAIVADINHYVLPLWLVTRGVLLYRWPSGAAVASGRSPAVNLDPAPGTHPR